MVETREAEATYSAADFATRLRRLADAVETGGPFWIRFAGERFRVPARAVFSIEHEREEDEEEVEFQISWRVEDSVAEPIADEPEV